MSFVQGKHYCYRVVTIAASGTTSTVADMEDYTVVGIEMPATLTGTEVTFTGSGLPTGLLPIRTVGDNSLFVAASGGARRVNLPYEAFLSARFVAVVSNDTEAAARTFRLIGYKP